MTIGVVVDRLWLGGSPCSGKSTVAGIIAASRNVPLYRCDDAFERHAAAVGAASGPILVEGSAPLPELLADRDVPRDRAPWIVPTKDFQHRHYGQRKWAHDLLASTADPERAFARWMHRDATFAQFVADQARELGYPVITVDGTASAADVAATVENLLDPA